MTIYMLSVHGADDFEMPDDFNIEEVYADVDKVNKEMHAEGRVGVRRWPAPVRHGDRRARRWRRDRHHRRPLPRVEGAHRRLLDHQGADLDEALAWAKKATVACRGPVEVRPFQDDTEV